MLAAIPHVVGIVCGHVYHFFTVVHPLMGAKRRVGAPGWMKRRLDGGDNPNFMEAPGGKHVRFPSPFSQLIVHVNGMLRASWPIINTARIMWRDLQNGIYMLGGAKVSASDYYGSTVESSGLCADQFRPSSRIPPAYDVQHPVDR